MNRRHYLVAIVVATFVASVAIAQESTDSDKGSMTGGEASSGEARDAKPSDAGGEASSGEARDAKPSEGAKAFLQVYEVLQHPRCMNCHPAGNRPLQTDESRPHRMNVSRKSEDAGLDCATCHREKNSEELGVDGGPPGAPHWGLPPAEAPMIFEGRTPAQLCAQLNDPEQTHGKSLTDLLEHVSHDALVLWGWNPGGDRTKPPLEHAEFVKHFETWVSSGGACPQ